MLIVVGNATVVGEWRSGVGLPNWLLAVVISISASAVTVTGFVLQKRALHDAHASAKKWPRAGDVILSPAWIFGFLVTAIFPVLGDLLAYSLAPLSLTAPLSGVSVVLNMVIAPWCLRENLQAFPDALATALILVGCVLTTAFGDHSHKDPYGLTQLMHLALQPPFLCGLVLGFACAIIVVARQHRLRPEIEKLASEQPQNPHLPHVLLPAVVASLCGAVANIGLKGVGELLRYDSPHVQVLLCVLFVAPAAALQVNFINRGLLLYPQSVFLSVYGAILVLMNTMYGALFYEEYKALLASRMNLIYFAVGCALILLGIWLFKFRQPSKCIRFHKDEEIGEELGNITEEAILTKQASSANVPGASGNDGGRCRTRGGTESESLSRL